MLTLNNSTCSSTTATRAEGDCNRDPPGLSNEILDLVGVALAEHYERNLTLASYVLTTDHQL